VINENAPHELRRYREKVRAVFPIYAVLIDEPEINFMNQGSWLEAVVAALPQHVAGGQTMEFVVNEIEQPTFGGAVSLAPFEQKVRNFDSRGHNEIHFLLGEPALIQPVPDKGFAGYGPRWFPDMSEFYRNSVPFSQLFPRSLP
jgi:hypothetical protein